jgi:uncharacterized protein (DUF302 family)
MMQDNSLLIKTTIGGSFEKVVQKLNDELLKVGFGLISEVDMSKKLEEKLKVNIKPYKILGFCNPKFAFEALQENNDIGVFLPCTIVVKQLDNSTIEVVAASPASFMKMLKSDKLNLMADEVTEILKQVIEVKLS